MATLVEKSRLDYKNTYEELIKFEQDHCTVQAASVAWLLYIYMYLKDHLPCGVRPQPFETS